MKRTFIALVGLSMLAELVDREKLARMLDSVPQLDQWQEVRQIIEREIGRRGKKQRPTAGEKEGDSRRVA